jgi:predicted Zn finger-like uncharacterized protein
MLIDCPGCANSYHINRAMLAPNGRNVACPRCSASWYVAPEPAEDEAFDAGGMEISAEAVSQKPVAADAVQAAVAGRKRFVPAPLRIVISRDLWLGVACVGLVMAAIAYRGPIVRYWPQAATAYAGLGLPVNLRGLALHDLHMVTTETAGEPVLGIEGAITNLKSSQNRVPTLRLSLRDAQSREIYAWTVEAPKGNLAIGETVTFRARLAAPPANAQALLVSFAPAVHERLALK